MSGGKPPKDAAGRGLLVAALACGAVLLVLLVCGVAARSGSWASGRPHAAATAVPKPVAGDTDTSTDTSTPAPIRRGTGPGVDFVAYLLTAFTLVLALLGVLLLADLVRLPARRPWRRQLVSSEVELADDVRVSDDEVLHDAVERALVEIADQPDAREAVVRAWLLLGEAAAVAGTPRRPAESAREYARRLGDKHRLPADSLERLAALYREARFSDHQMLPEQRDVARSELFALQTALAAGVDLAGFR